MDAKLTDSVIANRPTPEMYKTGRDIECQCARCGSSIYSEQGKPMSISNEPKIMGIAPWFGAKRDLAPKIVQLIGRHRVYWEPFCGSLAVLFAKEQAVMETANDMHGHLINLARALKDEQTAIELYGRMSRLVFHEQLFEEARNCVVRDESRAPEIPDLDRAEAFLVCSWFGRNGVAGCKNYNLNFSARYTANGGHAATRWEGVVASIPAWHRRLCRVTILQRDAFELLEKIKDAEGAVVYCDPPYVVKKAKYKHDFDDQDHDRLARALRRFQKTRVLVSYYDHPKVSKLYDGWSRHDFTVTKSLVSSGQRDGANKVQANEVVFVNDRASQYLF